MGDISEVPEDDSINLSEEEPSQKEKMEIVVEQQSNQEIKEELVMDSEEADQLYEL